MKTFLNCLLLVLLMSFQPSAHAGLLTVLMRFVGEATVDLVKGSKPVGRSATRLIQNESDHKGNVSDDPYEYLLERQKNVFNQTNLMRQTRPTAPAKTK